jgi:hypothetical protein
MSNELRIFVPLAIRAIMNNLAPRIEACAQTTITQLIDLNPVIPERISAGEAYDIGLTNPPYAKALFRSGHADNTSHRAFGRVPLAIARKAGPGGEITEDVKDIKALLHRAQGIGYTGAGTSGQTYLDVIKRLGMGRDVLPKSHAMGGGAPVEAVASGDAELAIAPLTTVLSSPGVAPAAIFPVELKAHIDMSIFLSCKPQTGATTVHAFLTSSALDDELAAAGVLRFQLD